MNDVTYSEDIQNIIIANLDGWQVITPISNDAEENEATETTEVTEEIEVTEETVETDISPFMTSTEAYSKANKTITSTECQMFYEETLDMAYMHTNRLNIDDLTEVEARVFIRGVCKWTASNLWNKYNIRVNNEDMEDTYVQSYGGLLYKSALKTLQPFINQRVMSVSGIRADDSDSDDIWIT